jgi:hypothetical protein
MKAQSFYFIDNNGDALTSGYNCQADVYDRSGSFLYSTGSLPEVGGWRTVLLTDELYEAGCIVMIDADRGNPLTDADFTTRYQISAVSQDNTLVATRYFYLSGSLYNSGALPTWGVYSDVTGSDYLGAAPAWNALPSGAFFTSIPKEHLAVGILGSVFTPEFANVYPEVINYFLVEGGTAETDPPYITNVQPPTGSYITSQTPISFDVMDDQGFRRIIVHASYPASLTEEVVHNGDAFGLRYTNISNVVSPITGGYSYTILRDGGWPQGPTITPYAFDYSGGENP